MTDPALGSARNHQGRPWLGPGTGTPLKSGSVHATADHARGFRRSLINGICYSATVVSREVVEFGFAGLGVAIMTETAIV
jgi:hypothetical protein